MRAIYRSVFIFPPQHRLDSIFSPLCIIQHFSERLGFRLLVSFSHVSCSLFTVLSNIVRGSASNAMCSVSSSSSSFSFLVPHSYFLTFCAILNTLFDTVFSLCYRLTSVFFTILVLCPACCSTRNLSTVCVYRCAWAWISGEICSILRTLAVIDIFG